MKTKRNPHVGGTVREHIGEHYANDPAFREAFDKLRLARRLRELRKELGLTQTELADRIHTKQSSIARIESGRVVPDLNFLAKVARALGLRLTLGFEPASPTS